VLAYSVIKISVVSHLKLWCLRVLIWNYVREASH
jgi:hypothetical protein